MRALLSVGNEKVGPVRTGLGGGGGGDGGAGAGSGVGDGVGAGVRERTGSGAGGGGSSERWQAARLSEAAARVRARGGRWSGRSMLGGSRVGVTRWAARAGRGGGVFWT